MNGEYLYEAMNFVGQDLIEQGEKQVLGRRRRKNMGALAACAAVVAGICLASVQLLTGRTFPATAPGYVETVPEVLKSDTVLLTACQLVSLLLGILAWVIPILAVRFVKQRRGRQWCLLGSFTACISAVVLQLVQINSHATQGNWERLTDSIDLAVLFVGLLLAVTVLLNILPFLKKEKTKADETKEE